MLAVVYSWRSWFLVGCWSFCIDVSTWAVVPMCLSSSRSRSRSSGGSSSGSGNITAVLVAVVIVMGSVSSAQQSRCGIDVRG